MQLQVFHDNFRCRLTDNNCVLTCAEALKQPDSIVHMFDRVMPGLLPIASSGKSCLRTVALNREHSMIKGSAELCEQGSKFFPALRPSCIY